MCGIVVPLEERQCGDVMEILFAYFFHTSYSTTGDFFFSLLLQQAQWKLSRWYDAVNGRYNIWDTMWCTFLIRCCGIHWWRGFWHIKLASFLLIVIMRKTTFIHHFGICSMFCLVFNLHLLYHELHYSNEVIFCCCLQTLFQRILA